MRLPPPPRRPTPQVRQPQPEAREPAPVADRQVTHAPATVQAPAPTRRLPPPPARRVAAVPAARDVPSAPTRPASTPAARHGGGLAALARSRPAERDDDRASRPADDVFPGDLPSRLPPQLPDPPAVRAVFARFPQAAVTYMRELDDGTSVEVKSRGPEWKPTPAPRPVPGKNLPTVPPAWVDQIPF